MDIDERLTNYWWICKTRWQFEKVKWASQFFPTEFASYLAWSIETFVRLAGAWMVWKQGMNFTEYAIMVSAMGYMKGSLLSLTSDAFKKINGFESLAGVAQVKNNQN